MEVRTLRSATVCMLCAISPMAAGADSAIDTNLLNRAKSEMRASFELYRAASRHLEEEAELIYVKPQSAPGKFTTRTTLTKSFTDGERFRFERVTVLDGKSDEALMTIDCRNEEYRFSLRKSNPNAAYVLVSYSLIRPDDARPGGSFHIQAYDLMEFILDAIDGRPGSSLNTFTWEPNKHLVKAAVRKKYDSQSSRTVDYEVWLEPDHQWRIVKQRTTTINAIIDVNITYGQVIDDLVYPAKIESITTLRTGKTAASPSKVDVAVKVSKAALPDSAYLLSAFGLPEPVDASPIHGKRLPNYIWLLIGACVCGILAVVLKHLSRGKSAPILRKEPR